MELKLFTEVLEELEVLRYLSEVLPQELFNTSHVMEARAFIKQLNEKPGLEEKLARIVFGLSKPTLDIKSLMILTQGRWAKSTLQRAHSPKGQQSLDDDRGASEPLSLETSKDNEAQKAAPTSVPLTPHHVREALTLHRTTRWTVIPQAAKRVRSRTQRANTWTRGRCVHGSVTTFRNMTPANFQ